MEKKKRRGHRQGTPGPGRRSHDHLPVSEEIYDLSPEKKFCSHCGLTFHLFPGTEDSTVVETEVRAYRRKIKRKKYTPTCRCPNQPGIVIAPSPGKLIPKGILGVSVWVKILLDKFLYQRPTNRLLTELETYGLFLSPGTITDGLKRLAPLFKPLLEAMLHRLRSASHWHADETGWLVFVEKKGKKGPRWYLWVFVSHEVVYFEIDPSRSSEVPKRILGKATGFLSVDRYSSYKFVARTSGGQLVLVWCWAHIRRDFLKISLDRPFRESLWALDWVKKIREGSGEFSRLSPLEFFP